MLAVGELTGDSTGDVSGESFQNDALVIEEARLRPEALLRMDVELRAVLRRESASRF